MLQKLFGFDATQHKVRTEVIAGLTTFLTMAYILAVNPSIFSALEPLGMPNDAVFTFQPVMDWEIVKKIKMKRPLVLLLLVLMTAAVWAQQISEEQARDRALKYLTANDAAQSRGMKVAMDRKLVRARTDAKRIYAFNLEGGGYVIASGDSRALPVLGYSATGTIDWDRMPDNMRGWLKSYDEAMATLGDTKVFTDGVSTYGQKTRAPREAIDPLIKTQWNQLEPYWNDTPPYDGANPDWQGQPSLTGCVATAMAMVMNYYQWPKEACTEIPAYDLTTAHENVEKVWHIDALPPTTFDWDQMLDNYETSEGTPEQQAAVAKLMRYCGQACKMKYTPEASGSTPQYVVEALIRYFGYQNTAHIAERVYYSIDGWEDLVYQELANGRPVQYAGSSDVERHISSATVTTATASSI